MATSKRRSPITTIARALSLAGDLNALGLPYAGKPCCTAFALARELAVAAFGEAEGPAIVDLCVSWGEYTEDAVRAALAELAEPAEVDSISGKTREQLHQEAADAVPLVWCDSGPACECPDCDPPEAS